MLFAEASGAGDYAPFYDVSQSALAKEMDFYRTYQSSRWGCTEGCLGETQCQFYYYDQASTNCQLIRETEHPRTYDGPRTVTAKICKNIA